ncbi:MAG: c-type cytochrome [Gemmatimonadota bacterium]
MPLQRPIKWFGIALGVLLLLVVAAGTVFGLIGRSRLKGTPVFPPDLAQAPTDSTTLAEGERLVTIFGCRGCHGPDLGGQLVVDMPLGRFVAPNLTSGAGGVGDSLQPADWNRAIRFGIRRDSTHLAPFMPFELFNQISDADASAMIAYLRQAPAVDHVIEPTHVRLLGYIVLGASSRESMLPALGRPSATSPTPGTIEQGAYIAAIVCSECHGERLTGGQHPAPDAPPGPSLIHYGNWPVDSLERVVRSGVGPGNRALNHWMPSKGQLDRLSDEELVALHAYIRSLRPT